MKGLYLKLHRNKIMFKKEMMINIRRCQRQDVRLFHGLDHHLFLEKNLGFGYSDIISVVFYGIMDENDPRGSPQHYFFPYLDQS